LLPWDTRIITPPCRPRKKSPRKPDGSGLIDDASLVRGVRFARNATIIRAAGHLAIPWLNT
jgi:hypothetical protein